MGKARFFACCLAITIVLLACGGASANSAGLDDIHVIGSPAFRVIPEAESWRISFALLSSSGNAPARVTEIRVNGQVVPSTQDGAPQSLPVNHIGNIRRDEIGRLVELNRKALRDGLVASEMEEFRDLKTRVGKSGKDGTVTTLELHTKDIQSAVKDGQDYTIDVEIGRGTESALFQVLAQVRSLPTDASWSPTDTHLHSTFSDGNLSPSDIKYNIQTMGYKVLYFTDHCDLLAGTWGGQVLFFL